MGLVWPEDQRIVVRSMAGETVKRVSLLGSDNPTRWELTGEGLVVRLPCVDRDTIGFTLKIVI